VTAAAGALRNAFSSIGWTTTSAPALMVNMLLMGDAWDANSGNDRRTRLSDLSGGGRIHMHWPSSTDLTAPWGWGWRSFVIHQGQTISWNVGSSAPESPLIQQWKWAALWFESDLQNVADIDFEVYDTCPPGGGEILVASDSSRDLRARFMLLQPEIANRCLQMRAYGYLVPSGGRVVWSADYFHSGDPSTH
jgi:hypothetical protein